MAVPRRYRNGSVEHIASQRMFASQRRQRSPTRRSTSQRSAVRSNEACHAAALSGTLSVHSVAQRGVAARVVCAAAAQLGTWIRRTACSPLKGARALCECAGSGQRRLSEWCTAQRSCLDWAKAHETREKTTRNQKCSASLRTLRSFSTASRTSPTRVCSLSSRFPRGAPPLH